MGKLMVVVGGQFGSEGKGAIAAYLSKVDKDFTQVHCVRVAGPNAGHTVWGEKPNGEPIEFKLRVIPTGAVTNRNSILYIAAGSEIDIDVMRDEIANLEANGYPIFSRLYIDSAATILEPRHIKQEQEAMIHENRGSTAKGIGAARADRIWRNAKIWKDVNVLGDDTGALLRGALRRGDTVLIEGTQGYGLGLHTEHYPLTTSSDCRAIDFLGMAGLSPWAEYVTEFEVWIVFRTRPIRVAGPSGELKGETTWDRLGLKEERTTVTNKVRRVGEWDYQLAARAIEANGGRGPHLKIALTMVDQVVPEIHGHTWETVPTIALQYGIEHSRRLFGKADLLGTSPTHVIDLREPK